MPTAADAVAAARRTLQDLDFERISDADLLKYVNAARRAFAVARPSAYDTTADIDLVAGPAQTVPANCAIFYGLVGAVSGSAMTTAITPVEAEYLDALEPGWRAATPAVPVHYIFDERTPRTFEVYPPAAAGQKVRHRFSAIPTDLASGDAMSGPESLVYDALVSFAVGRALMDDPESPENMQTAMVHMQAFASITGANLRSLIAMSPNVANLGGRVPRAGQ